MSDHRVIHMAGAKHGVGTTTTAIGMLCEVETWYVGYLAVDTFDAYLISGMSNYDSDALDDVLDSDDRFRIASISLDRMYESDIKNMKRFIDEGRVTVIDWGAAMPIPAITDLWPGVRVGVVDNSYPALMRGVRCSHIDKWLGIMHPARAIRVRDMEQALGASVTTLEYEPAIQRSVDAGLMVQAGRSTASYDRILQDVVRSWPGV